MKGKASTPARIVIKGRVKGPPEVEQKSGTTVITKELQEGAEIEETFPRRRKTGKQRPVPQLVPTEDVVRLVEEATRVLADGSAKFHQAETNRKVQLVGDLASQEIDKARAEAKKEKRRADYAKGRLAARKPRARAPAAAPDRRLTGRREASRTTQADRRIPRLARLGPPTPPRLGPTTPPPTPPRTGPSTPPRTGTRLDSVMEEIVRIANAS